MTERRSHRVRASRPPARFDIRNIIGGLLGVYGVILTADGPLRRPARRDKTGDVNANLWAGLVLLAASAVFLVWARLRPVVVSVARGTRRSRAPGRSRRP